MYGFVPEIKAFIHSFILKGTFLQLVAPSFYHLSDNYTL